jgi:hypothetical protein
VSQKYLAQLGYRGRGGETNPLVDLGVMPLLLLRHRDELMDAPTLLLHGDVNDAVLGRKVPSVPLKSPSRPLDVTA